MKYRKAPKRLIQTPSQERRIRNQEKLEAEERFKRRQEKERQQLEAILMAEQILRDRDNHDPGR